MIGRDFLEKIAEVFAANALTITISIFVSAAIARILGPEARGLYEIAITITAIAVQLGNCGLHASSVYFVSKYGNRLVPALIGNAVVVSVVIGVFAGGLLPTLAIYAPKALPLDWTILPLVIVAIPAGLLLLIFQNLLLGSHLVRQFNINSLVVKLVPAALLPVIVLTNTESFQIFFFAVLVGTVIGVGHSYKHLYSRSKAPIVFSRPLFKKTFDYGIKAYLAALFSFLVIQQDILMIQYFLGEEQVGYYGVAGRIAGQLMLFGAAVSTILFPTLSALKTQQEKWQTTKRVLGYTALVLAIVFAIAAFFSEPIILLLFGKAYVPAIATFQLLIPGIWFLLLAAILQNFMAASEHPGAMIYGPLIAAVFNFGANVVLIDSMGINGAALASTVSYLLFFLVSITIIRYRRLNQ